MGLSMTLTIALGMVLGVFTGISPNQTKSRDPNQPQFRLPSVRDDGTGNERDEMGIFAVSFVLVAMAGGGSGGGV